MNEQKTFSQRLQILRKQKRLAASAVAQACGVAESTYREWEHGRQIRGSRPYSSLAEILGVSLSELLMGKKGGTIGIEEDLKHIEALLREIRAKL